MKKLFTFTALMLCTVLAVVGCGKKEETDKPVEEVTQASAVEILTVSKSNIQNEYIYSGTVKPADEVNVLSTLSGKIAKVNYDIGDKVKKGDVLFSMDTTDTINSMNVQKAMLATAEANISTAKTNLDLVNGGAMQSQIENAKATLANAELAYNNALTAYENNKVLFASGVVSQTDMDKIETAYKQAETSYNLAKESYNITANELPAENLRKAQDALNTAQASKQSSLAQIKSFEKTLSDANVTSPISGVVAARNATAGTMLSQSAGAPFVIINTDKVNISVNVSEQIINSLAVGQDVNVKIAAVSDTLLTGKISTVNPAAGQTGTYEVKIELNNDNGNLKSGMFGEVYFAKDKSENTIVLPRSTVINKDDEDFVYIEENGIAKKIVVETGLDNGDNIEIKTGISEGMNVVIKGQTYLSDGDKVEIITSSTKGE